MMLTTQGLRHLLENMGPTIPSPWLQISNLLSLSNLTNKQHFPHRADKNSSRGRWVSCPEKKHNKIFSTCYQNLKNVLQFWDLREMHSLNSTLCATLLNSSTSDNEVWHFIAGKIPRLQTKTTTAHVSPPPPPPPISSHRHESFEHCRFFVFFLNPWEDLYSRWGPGHCFLNINEPLDRGSRVRDCCPRCPLAARPWAAVSNPHYASLLPSDT